MSFESLDSVKVLDRTGNSALLEFSVPKTSPYFDGHFPGFNLLPAVAQIELVIRFAAEYFTCGIDILEMRRVKFTKFILPNMPLLMRLEKDENTISFKIFASQGKDVYSTGTLLVSLDRERNT